MPSLPSALAARAWTSAGVRDGVAKMAAVLTVDSATSNRDYPFEFNMGAIYTRLPKKMTVFVAHNTGVNLNATAGQHLYNYSPQHDQGV